MPKKYERIILLLNLSNIKINISIKDFGQWSLHRKIYVALP